MKEELVKRRRSALTSFLVSGVVGAGAALLVAPKPGKDLRKDLKRISTSTGNRITEALDKGKELYSDGREAVTDIVEAGRKTVHEGREKIERLTGRRKKSMILPIIVSGIGGAAATFLLTPKSGREIRKDIKRISSSAKNRVSEAVDSGIHLYEKGRSAVTHAVEAGRHTLAEGKVKLRRVA